MSGARIGRDARSAVRYAVKMIKAPLLIAGVVGVGTFGIVLVRRRAGSMALQSSEHDEYRVAAVMGIVQGLSEFLPVSSSAHLSVIPWLLDWSGEEYAFFNTQTFDVALHMGTLLALVVTFWQDWLILIGHAHRPHTPAGRLFWLLVLASLPGAAVGAVLESRASGYFNDKYLLIAVLLGSMGMVFYVVDRRVPERYDLSDLRWPAALGIGLAQAGALLPGVSRAGATMTMGRVLGLERATAAHFSFLMATPITFGAGLLKLRHLQRTAITPAFWLGIGLAFAVGMLAINVLLRFLQQRGHSFLPFVLYRLTLAAVIVLKRVGERGSTTH